MKLIIANWKLNPQKLSEAQKLVSALARVSTKNKVVICPPAIYLPVLKTKFDLGSQDLFWQEQGPFTGQISGSMLRQFKIKYAIIGHSEKRSLGESDREVNMKVQAALRNKIIPVLCVGFGLEYGMADEDVLMHLRGQLENNLAGADATKVIVAYEPVWAISSGSRSAEHVETAEHAERVAMFIRIKFKVHKVLYGGSSNVRNFAEFLAKDIDGLLVGGASLRLAEFSKMISYK